MDANFALSPARRAAYVAAFLMATAALVAAVWIYAYGAALDQAEERGRADLALASDRLSSQLQRFRELGVLLSDHPTLMPVALAAHSPEQANELLRAMADKTGSLSLQLVGPDGGILASSDGNKRPSRGVFPALNRAFDGALGAAHYVSEDARRVYTIAAPVFEPNGPAKAAVLVHVDVAGIEWNWPADPATVFFTDSQEVVFITNRSELILKQKGETFPPFERQLRGFHEIWHLDGGRYLPEHALHLTRDMPVVGLTGELLLDLRPARAIAWLQAAATAALCLTFGAFLFLATERRRTLALANAALESRVVDRTAALEAANAELRREVGERVQAEARLKRAQAELVQAGKLSALGQMSAGISHELNQPLMAIRSFAENGALFLERDAPERAGQNFAKISDLARRMGRIIQNLRAFARQEKETISDVDLRGVVETVLEMAEGTLSGAEVRVDWQGARAPVMVRGGEVRLQQVVMNLISNGIDAMAETEDKRLEIAITQKDERVILHIRDSGPGISDPGKIFDPFYSTKEVGASEGMGLGLSISYGLVQSFGGAIRGKNRDSGGAEFTVELAAGSQTIAQKGAA
ncbi:MAG: two-component system C4-dicarboxylate transport sensor histidine kinase DctB [Halocynthiibacter sp.]|jgi:two-component system C4-dicarboxylate transport sensor histidine kinase DctB